ncbi:MAG: thiolase family protein [Bdellovibrionales bacterium]|nr:thiolase family protein [Bdellovibrionales bacterium]
MSAREPIYLCSPLRTPIGSFGGTLAGVPGPELGAHVIRAVLEQSGADPATIDEVIMGCILTAGQGQAPARQAVIKAGLPSTTQALTINKVCSSGLKAVMLAADSVALGHSDAIIAGGFENMSQSPYLLPALRNGARLGHSSALDSMIVDGLWDPYNDYHMGNAAELCARENKLTREAQDEFALQSYDRALAAIEQGKFKNEIVPITVRTRKDEVEFAEDEEPKNLKRDKVSSLRPVFDKNGTVTAANASTINDGAAAMLVCSKSYADKHGIKPIATLISQGWHGQAPEWFTTAPVGAMEMALKKAGKDIADIDLFEINEAFSAVALACGNKLSVDPNKLNIHGGAVALGHPLGASGARILTTLLHALNQTGGRVGAAAICNGGGEATSVVVEMV